MEAVTVYLHGFGIPAVLQISPDTPNETTPQDVTDVLDNVLNKAYTVDENSGNIFHVSQNNYVNEAPALHEMHMQLKNFSDDYWIFLTVNVPSYVETFRELRGTLANVIGHPIRITDQEHVPILDDETFAEYDDGITEFVIHKVTEAASQSGGSRSGRSGSRARRSSRSGSRRTRRSRSSRVRRSGSRARRVRRSGSRRSGRSRT